jgi:hypothetical protein
MSAALTIDKEPEDRYSIKKESIMPGADNLHCPNCDGTRLEFVRVFNYSYTSRHGSMINFPGSASLIGIPEIQLKSIAPKNPSNNGQAVTVLFVCSGCHKKVILNIIMINGGIRMRWDERGLKPIQI